MKRSSDRVIKSRHKGLSRKEFNRWGVSILWGEVGSRRTLLDCREGEGRRRLIGPEGSLALWAGLQPLHTAGTGDTQRYYSSVSVCSSYQIKCLKIGPLFHIKDLSNKILSRRIPTEKLSGVKYDAKEEPKDRNKLVHMTCHITTSKGKGVL